MLSIPLGTLTVLRIPVYAMAFLMLRMSAIESRSSSLYSVWPSQMMETLNWTFLSGCFLIIDRKVNLCSAFVFV